MGSGVVWCGVVWCGVVYCGAGAEGRVGVRTGPEDGVILGGVKKGT